MVLLSNLKQKIKFWWRPHWELNYSYVVDSKSREEPVTFRITRGKYCGVTFTLEDIRLNDAEDGSGGIVSFESNFIFGKAPKDIVVAIFQDALMRAIDNSNQLHREVLNDRSEDCELDYFEELVDERRVCPPSSSIHKE